MKEYADCYACHSKEQRLLLHNIRLRGEYRQLCTSCVLKHHAGTFCPHCFEIYQGFNPPVDHVTCSKCDSPSHLGCVSKDFVSRYLCPSCLNPSHVYFDVGGGGGLNNKNKTSTSSSQDSNKRVIDTKLSKILLTATQFASVSMKRGAAAERIEAEKRVKEAWVTRKKAREALQEVHSTALRLKGSSKESKMIQRIPSPVAVEEPMKRPKGNSAVADAVAAQKRIQNLPRLALLEGGNNANVRPVTNGAPAAAVGSNNKLKGSPTTVMGYQQFRNAAAVNGKDKSLNISQLRINDAKLESEKNNGLLLVPKTEGLLKHPQINHPIKEDPDEMKEFGFPQLIQSNEGSVDGFNSRNNKGVLHAGSSKTMS